MFCERKLGYSAKPWQLQMIENIVYCQNIVMIIIDTIGWKNYEYGTEYGKKGQK